MIDCPRCGRENEEGARFCTECGNDLKGTATTRERKDTYLGRVLEKKYMILEHLGDGGMGKVYKAEHLMLNKVVAIKILHKTLTQNETQVKRFQREAWSASRLDHPNSIAIQDMGSTDDGSFFIVMEYLDGRELSDVIRQEFPLPTERIAHILGQVLSVLHEAHGNKIIHRDLKPDNIMLIRRAEEEDFAKVLDFGIAKLQERDPSMPALTMQGIVCGTPEYMSPEQALGRELDFRTDIYSVGCILYEMLTGDVPFVANNYQAILGMHIREDPEPPSLRCKDIEIHPKLEEIAMIAMNKKRDMRFSNALAMKHALELAVRKPSESDAMPERRVVNVGGVTKVMGSDDAPFSDSPDLDSIEVPAIDDKRANRKNKTLDALAVEDQGQSLNGENEKDEKLEPLSTDAGSESVSDSNSYSGSYDTMPGGEYRGGIGAGKLVAVAVILGLLLVVALYSVFGGDDGSEEEEVAAKLAIDQVKEAKSDAKREKPPGDDIKEDQEKIENGISEIDKKSLPEREKRAVESKKVETSKPKAPPSSRAETARVAKSREKKLSEMEKQKRSLEQYEKGKRAFDAGKYNKSVHHFNLAKKYNPQSPQIYKRLGMSYLKLGKKSQARSNLRKYLKMVPRASDAARIRELLETL